MGFQSGYVCGSTGDGMTSMIKEEHIIVTRIAMVYFNQMIFATGHEFQYFTTMTCMISRSE